MTSDQVPLYDDGMSADAKGLDHLLDGAFGDGVLQKIQDGCTRIAAKGLLDHNRDFALLRMRHALRTEILSNCGKKLRHGGEIKEPIAADAAIANSIAVRVEFAQTDMPLNLSLDDGALSNGYFLVTVADENAI